MGARQPRPYVVPRTARDLREGLKRMGIERINGRPLDRVRVDQLRAVERAARVVNQLPIIELLGSWWNSMVNHKQEGDTCLTGC